MPSLTTTYVYFVLNGLVCAFFFIFGIVVHELGHALSARVLGMQCISVRIGAGRQILQARLAWLAFEFRILPFKGITRFCPATLWLGRIRRLIVIASGPLANVALLGVAIFAAQGDWDFFARVDWWRMLALANILLLLCALFPSKSEWEAGETIWSDGISMLLTPFLTRANLERQHAGFFATMAAERFARDEFEEMRGWCESCLALYPNDANSRTMLGFAELFSKNFRGAREQWLRALEVRDLRPHIRSSLMVNVACADAVLRDSAAALARAEEFSRLAAEREPNSPAIQASRGEVLIALGEVERGTAMIAKFIDQVPGPKIKALNYCFLAVAEVWKGDLEAAKRHRELALQLDSKCVLLDMADAEIANPSVLQIQTDDA